MALSKQVLKLKGAARKAGIPGYGKMSESELRDALAGGSKSSGKRKSASALKTGKRKSAATVGRKQTGRKQTRKASVTKPKRGRPKGSTNKRKSNAPARAKATRNGGAGRNLIDRADIDWKADWSGGQSGNRALIMKALRKYKGNYDKVFDSLVGQVAKMYPKSTKTGQKYNQDERKALLRWHIGRTAFDFVTGTEQHTKSTNRKPDKRTHGPRGGSKKASVASSRTGKAKTTRKRSGSQKLAQGRTGKRGPGRPKGSKGKTTVSKKRTVKR